MERHRPHHYHGGGLLCVAGNCFLLFPPRELGKRKSRLEHDRTEDRAHLAASYFSIPARWVLAPDFQPVDSLVLRQARGRTARLAFVFETIFSFRGSGRLAPGGTWLGRSSLFRKHPHV